MVDLLRSTVHARVAIDKSLTERPHRKGMRWAKRAFDLLLAGMGLVGSAPLWGLVALSVKLDDGGPVFYGQTRVGRFLRGTAFDELPQLWNILKGEMSFVGPRALLPEEIEVQEPAAFRLQRPSLGGNHREAVPMEKIPGYEARHRVRPGLTGLAQVYAPRDIPRRHKFRYDLLYIRRQSFWLDLKLIALSFWITFHGKWEHRGRKF